MKRITFLFMFVCTALLTNAANYYMGAYPFAEMMAKMDAINGPYGVSAADWPWWSDTGERLFPTQPTSPQQFNLYASNLGFTKTVDVPSNGSVLAWASCNCGSYAFPRGIDWTDRNWQQKTGDENNILIEHSSETPHENELSFLEFIRLSGNQFRNIEIKGNGGMTHLTEVDLSDNATLEYLKITGVPNLRTLKATATTIDLDGAFLFSTLSGISATTFNWTVSGTVNLTLPLNVVDFSAEFTLGTQFTNWSVQPASSNNGIFAFADNQVGQTVTVELTNAGYAGKTVQVSIILADGDYRITSAADLDNVRNHLGGKFTLDADIDLTDYITDTYGNEGWLPIGDTTNPFKGDFNGNGHVISGLWINRPTTDNVGLFGVVGNFRIMDGNATATPTTAATTLTGHIYDLAVIAGDIIGNYQVGGLAGVLGSAPVTGCYIYAKPYGKRNVGGIVGNWYGKNTGSVIQDCYVGGVVGGEHRIGGVAGVAFNNDAAMTLNRVYSTVKIKQANVYYEHASGGILGRYGAWDGGIKFKSVLLAADTLLAKNNGYTKRFIGSFVGNTNPATQDFSDSIFAFNHLEYRIIDSGTNYFYVNPNDTVMSLGDEQRHGINKTAQQLINQSIYSSENAVLNWDFSATGMWTMGNGCYPLPILKKLPASVQPDEYPAHLKFDVSVATSVTGEVGGSISTHTGVKAGDDIIVTVTPDADYAIDVFTVNGEDKTSQLVNNEYTLTCIKSDAAVSVTFKNTLPVYTGEGVWTDTDNWSTDETLTPEDKVIIDGDVTIAGDISIAGITINQGKSVTIDAGKQLTVSGTLSVNGTLNFKSDDSNGTAQLSGSSGVVVAGEVNVVKTFATDTWYPVGFPFAIASITIKQGANTYEGKIYGLDNSAEVVANPAHQNEATNQNIYLATYNGTNNKFYFTDALAANSGFVISIPSGTFTGGSIESGTVEVTFTAVAPTLNSVASATITDGYTLVANPNLVNAGELTGTNYYYEYNLSTQHFDRVEGGSSLDNALQPFAALVTYKGSDTGSALRSSFGVGDTDIVTGLPAINKNPVVAEQYYNLQGVEIAPAQSGIFIKKTVYQSGAVSVSKIIGK
ncbi:MAG: hypothetical protein LBH19_14240 [Dysgonamonadaceae bacterium]|jgi:hypothetical protein|nr:hypothetical protein [Dysgonamonadaceae bacterium]